MKRIFSILTLTAALFLLPACNPIHNDVTLLVEYLGNIQTTTPATPLGYSGFNVNFAVYSDYSCLLRTAVILEDNWTLDGVRHRNCKVVVNDHGFTLTDGSGTVIASATYCGPSMAPESEIELDWTTPICPEWEEYADIYGWSTPCELYVVSQNPGYIQ